MTNTMEMKTHNMNILEKMNEKKMNEKTHQKKNIGTKKFKPAPQRGSTHTSKMIKRKPI